MQSFYMTACRPLTARIEDRTHFSHLIFELPRDYNNNNNNNNNRQFVRCHNMLIDKVWLATYVLARSSVKLACPAMAAKANLVVHQ